MVGPTLTRPADCGWDAGTNALISGWRIVVSPIASPTRVVLSTSRCRGTCQVACRCTNPATSWPTCWYGLTLGVGVGMAACPEVPLGTVDCDEPARPVIGAGLRGLPLEALPPEVLPLEALPLEVLP